MVFKLVQAAEDRWRYVNGPHPVALVRAGAKFEKGALVERPDEAIPLQPHRLTPGLPSSGKATTICVPHDPA